MELNELLFKVILPNVEQRIEFQKRVFRIGGGWWDEEKKCIDPTQKYLDKCMVECRQGRLYYWGWNSNFNDVEYDLLTYEQALELIASVKFPINSNIKSLEEKNKALKTDNDEQYTTILKLRDEISKLKNTISTQSTLSIHQGKEIANLEKENKELKLHIESKRKFDIQPFEKVLVRDDDDCKWRCSLFSHIRNADFATVGLVYQQCVKYKGNETLLNTYIAPNEYWKINKDGITKVCNEK